MANVIKLGIFMTVCLIALGILIFRVEDIRLFGPEPSSVDVVFESVTGLDDKSPVRVAGVRVGRVDGISLEPSDTGASQARVRLVLETPVRLTEGSYASIANVSLLGEKYVELIQGPSGNPELPLGATIPGEVPVSWDQAIAKLSTIGDSVLGFTEGITGEGGDGNLGRLLDNLADMSAELRDLVASNRGQVEDTVTSFQSFSATLSRELPIIAEQMQRALSQIEGVIVENRDDFGQGLDNIRKLSESFQTSVDNLNQITTTLAQGEGSLGKLLNSDEAHDGLVGTLDSLKGGVEELRSTLGRIEKIQLDLGFEAYYLEDFEDSRSAFKLNIDPQSQRFYRLEAVNDPRGKVKSQVETITTTIDGVSQTEVIESSKVEDKFTLSAQLGFQINQVDLRGGLIESTAGAGIDWRLPSERFSLSLDAFDFGREIGFEELAPRLRLTGKWLAHPNVYVVGGYDDFLESSYGSVFLGVGIQWSDDDLKYLLGSVPTNF